MLRAQEKHISLLPHSRYVPVAPGRRAGIIVLKDTTPDEAEELVWSPELRDDPDAFQVMSGGLTIVV